MSVCARNPDYSQRHTGRAMLLVTRSPFINRAVLLGIRLMSVGHSSVSISAPSEPHWFPAAHVETLP